MRALGEGEKERHPFWVVFFCAFGFWVCPFFSLWCMFKRHGVFRLWAFWLLACFFGVFVVAKNKRGEFHSLLEVQC